MSIITPVGHSRGIIRREARRKGHSELERAFLQWKEMDDPWIGEAETLLEEVAISVEEVHELLLRNYETASEGASGAGLIATIVKNDYCLGFVSAAYEIAPDKVIVYDLDLPIDGLGFDLPKNKLLVNRGTTGDSIGLYGRGVVVNLGVTGHEAGREMEGILINDCAAGEMFGSCGKKGLAISMRPPQEYQPWPQTDFQGKMIRHDQITPPMRGYLEELVHLCAGPVTGIHDRYGDVPALQIRSDLDVLLGVRQ